MRKDWTETSLNEILERSIGGVWGSEPGTDQEEVLVVRSTEFTKSGYLNFDTGVKRSIKTSQLTSRELREGDILLEKSGGGPNQPVGRVVFVELDIPSKTVCSNFIQLLTPSSDVAVPRFIFFLMWMWHSQNKTLEYQAQTTGIRNLRTSDYLEQEVLLPSLAEQKRIVDLVSSVDAYIEALQHHADLARVARDAVLQELLSAGGDDWTETTIGEIAVVKGGKRLPKGTPWSESPTDHPYIRATDIRDGNVDVNNLVYVPDSVWSIISRYVVNSGDVLITIAGTIGAIGIVPESHVGANLTENAALIRPNIDLILPKFLQMFLMQTSAQAQIESLTIGTTQKKLGLFRIESIEIRLPALAEQERIVEIVSSVDGVIQSTEQAVINAKALRSGLLSDLLSGNHEIPASYDSLLGAA